MKQTLISVSLNDQVIFTPTEQGLHAMANHVVGERLQLTPPANNEYRCTVWEFMAIFAPEFHNSSEPVVNCRIQIQKQV